MSLKFAELSFDSQIIMSMSVMLVCGFATTRITQKFRLPDVTAYIITGILIGPFCLDLIPDKIISGMDFIADIALSFIAFSTGEYFKKSNMGKESGKILIITVFESVSAAVAVFAASFFVLKLRMDFSLILGALACATAPASTLMTIRQTHAKGDFVNILLQVVALDDVVGLVAYSAAIALTKAASGGQFQAGNAVIPILLNAAVFVLGSLFGFFMKLSIPKRSRDNRLIISVALLFTFCGICTALEVSPLLGCMSMGMVYVNTTGDCELFAQLNNFSPPILMLFFVRSGLNFDLSALFNAADSAGSTPLLSVGVTYFFARIAGKYAGAYVGCALTGKEASIRQNLGLALIPQAGVAIGLAALGARALGGENGKALETVILASSVLYELAGPACAKLSLYLSGAYAKERETKEYAK